MGTFVSNPSEELFDDKEPAAGTSRPREWTADNVLTADELNATRDAIYDLRTAHLAAVAGSLGLSDATPGAVGTAAAGVATTASRNDHVHAHGNQLGGTLHAAAGASAGFMSAADKTKLDAISGTHTGANTGDVTIGTANGLSLVAQALSLATAVAGVSAGALSAADKTKLDAILGTNTGDVTLGTTNGLSLVGQALSLAVAGGSAGAMSAADKTKLDAITGTHTGSNTGDVTIGTANGLSLVAQALSLATAVAGVSAGALSAADKTKLDGVTAGATAGVTTMAAVGSSPSANGASISGSTLTLQPASGSQPGVVTTGTQTFAGAKSFSSAPAFPDATTQATSAVIAPSVVISAQAALPASLNLTTQGVIDWMHIHSLTGLQPFLTATHKKIGGEGEILASFAWIKSPGGGSVLTNGDLDFPCTITNSDDIDGAGISAYENGTYINVTATQTGHGFQFRCRATRAQRVLRVYMGRNATTVLCTATLTDGTSDTESVAVAGGSPTVFQLGQLLVITFNAATDNQFLTVKFQATTTHSTAGTVNFHCATLAAS